MTRINGYICDFCNVKDTRATSTPSGWSALKVELRNSNNSGGTMFRVHACDACKVNIQYVGSHERAIEFLKESVVRPGSALPKEIEV